MTLTVRDEDADLIRQAGAFAVYPDTAPKFTIWPHGRPATHQTAAAIERLLNQIAGLYDDYTA